MAEIDRCLRWGDSWQRQAEDIGPCVEVLEPRQFFSAAGISVGAFFDGTFLTPYAGSGTISDTGVVTATIRDAGPGGFGPEETSGVDGVQFLQGGRYRPHFRSSFTPYQSMNGAQFLNSRSYPAGWFSGLDAGYSRAEFTLIAEQAQGVTSASVQGSWQYSALLITATNAIGAWGQIDISGSAVARTTNGPGFSLNDTISVTSVSPDGTIRTSDGQYAYMANNQNIGLGIDPDSSDGQMAVGILARTTSARTMGQIAGGYRVGMAVTGSLAASTSGRDAALVNYFLDLSSDGIYRQYDLQQYDSGNRSPLAQGTWARSGDSISLTQTGRGLTWVYLVVADGLSLMPRFFVTTAGESEVVVGMATRVARETGAVFSVARNDGGSIARVYELDDDARWRSADLQGLAGGPAVSGRVVSWTDPKDGLVYAAALQSGGGLGLYREDANGAWSYRNLSGTAVARNLDVMIAPDGRVNLVGLAQNGDLLRYYQTLAVNVWGDYEWASANIAQSELRANGDAMPTFSGATVSYATSWGGLNVAGLDATGNIWSVWWAPGAARWFASNLTSAYGTDPVAGGLCVYLTPWGGINLGAINSAGQLVVTWWVPQFQGTWAHSNLTTDTGGPLLTSPSATSYVSSWGGLNIAGVDSQTGEVKVYWWSPARVQDGWAVTSLTGTVGAGVPQPFNALQGIAATDASLNVFGVSSTGSLIRYFWEPGFGGTWQGQNVSQIAVPLG